MFSGWKLLISFYGIWEFKSIISVFCFQNPIASLASFFIVNSELFPEILKAVFLKKCALLNEIKIAFRISGVNWNFLNEIWSQTSKPASKSYQRNFLVISQQSLNYSSFSILIIQL